MHIFGWCSSHVQIFRLCHAVANVSIEVTKLRLQTDRLFKPPSNFDGGGGIIRFATDINPVSFLIF